MLHEIVCDQNLEHLDIWIKGSKVVCLYCVVDGIEQSKFSYLLSERSGEGGGCEGCKEVSFLEKDTISNRMS